MLVAIFASLLFQSGLEFWFSDRARTMLENTVQVARATFDSEVERVANETVTMSGDLAGYLRIIAIDDPRFAEAFGRNQVLNRNLSEAIIFTYGADRQIRTLALVNPYDRPLDQGPSRSEVVRHRLRCRSAGHSERRGQHAIKYSPHALSLLPKAAHDDRDALTR